MYYTVAAAPFYRTLPNDYSNRIGEAPTQDQKKKRFLIAILLSFASLAYTTYLLYTNISRPKKTQRFAATLQITLLVLTVYSLYLYLYQKA